MEKTTVASPAQRWGRPGWVVVMIGLICAAIGLATPVTAVSDGEPVGEGASIFSRPVPGPVVRGFDPPQRDWLVGHRGVDLRVDKGEEVRAGGDGTVVFAGTLVDRPVISIDHPVGIRTTYEPVEPLIESGQKVKAGQVIGHIAEGNDHCPQPCLHWGAKTGPKQYVDPLGLLNPPIIRLFPPQPW
ncbi:MAG TPA: M23 family metallopeptidase [Beutenbergiaceae bacterium]|nr:M23 family metallopeptidase [Beutenbergiaceae bacterium]